MPSLKKGKFNIEVMRKNFILEYWGKETIVHQDLLQGREEGSRDQLGQGECQEIEEQYQETEPFHESKKSQGVKLGFDSANQVRHSLAFLDQKSKDCPASGARQSKVWNHIEQTSLINVNKQKEDEKSMAEKVEGP